MSDRCTNHTRATPPKPEIVVAPCIQLDHHGLWATARVMDTPPSELDLFVPIGRSARRVEVGHGAEALRAYGQRARHHVLAALDRALARPLRLVVDPRLAEGSTCHALDESGSPREEVVSALASILDAASVRLASYAMEFALPAPKAGALGCAAASLYGPMAMRLFGAAARNTVQGTVMLPLLYYKQDRLPTPGAGARVATYIRTAVRNPWGRNTVEAQRRRAEAFAERHGFAVLREIVDEAESGLDTCRPGLAELFRAADADEIDAVIVGDISRLSRSDDTCLRIFDRLQRSGVAVLAVDEMSVG